MTHPRTPILLILLALLALPACAKPKRFPTVPKSTDTFAILGDVRLPHSLELWKSDNDRERTILIRALAERNLAFVAIHGDFVFKGSSARLWRKFDRTFAPLRWRGIPILPALGNHEYVGDDDEALNHYFARFPELNRKRWYRRDLKQLAILVLDSNRKPLGAALWRKQRAWFAAQLTAIDADPKVRGVVVFIHHPVFTNSPKHKGYPPVKRDLLPLFVKARKTLAMVSAHVHTYERFIRFDKLFVNSGGGGAPRRPLRTGDDRRHKDDLFRGPRLRPFHFVQVQLTDQGLSWAAHGLRRRKGSLYVMERYHTPWPSAGQTPARPPRKAPPARP